MDQTRLTCRLPRDILAGAKRYANGYNTTLTRPVSEYLRQPGTQDDPLADAPVVRQLQGALSQDAAVDELASLPGREICRSFGLSRSK